jgi:hypothetical protein
MPRRRIFLAVFLKSPEITAFPADKSFGTSFVLNVPDRRKVHSGHNHRTP